MHQSGIQDIQPSGSPTKSFGDDMAKEAEIQDQTLLLRDLKLRTYLVFPCYVSGAPTRVQPISTLKALEMITMSGYEVKDSYDESTIQQWIKLVEGFKKYTITYSDMEDARQHLEGLMYQ